MVRQGIGCSLGFVTGVIGGGARWMHRNLHGERAALAEFALYLDVATHHLAEVLADRQSQPGAAIFAGDRRVALHERAEKLPKLFWSHSDSRVADSEARPLGLRLAAPRDCDPDHALLGKFRGVTQ